MAGGSSWACWVNRSSGISAGGGGGSIGPPEASGAGAVRGDVSVAAAPGVPPAPARRRPSPDLYNPPSALGCYTGDHADSGKDGPKEDESSGPPAS